MSEKSLDPFEIDMELLRRVSVVRTSFQTLDPGQAESVAQAREAVANARVQAQRSDSPVDALLDLVEDALKAVEAGEAAPPHLATSLTAVLPAAEEAILAPGDAQILDLLKQAEAALLSALGRDASQWNASTLDDVATLLVEMDPEEGDAVARLGQQIAAAVDQAPQGVVEWLLQAQTALAPALKKRSRKATRSQAVAEVSALVESAVLALETLETEEVEDTGPVEHVWEPESDIPEEFFALDDAAPEAPNSAPAPVAESAPAAEAEPAVVEVIPSSDPLPANAEPELIGDFVTESFEYLEQAEEALLALESNPWDPEAVNVVFRAFHTIKGVSGFLELRRISDLAHHAESLLSRVRDGDLVFSGAVADLSLRGVDVLKALLSAVRSGLESGTIAVPAAYAPLHGVLSDPALPEKIVADEAGVIPLKPVEGQGEEAQPAAGKAAAVENSVRIRTDRLDQLVDMVGELVIAHSMLSQDPMVLRDRGGLSRKVDHTTKILRELQDLSTSLRMVPLKPAFRKVSRVVRDLSKKNGKDIRLITDGEDTEIDRTMVDVLADPLVHMVRNSVDHGLESPEERVAAGKPPQGTVRISAYQAGGNVVIEVADDGRGLNRDRIIAKAKERGIIESERGMTDREIFNLIFAAGFSTAEKVTEVSGRGVGMDVVRRNVESLRGRVSIDSVPGEGSTFSINLPLTLAITDGMVIRVGQQRYIIPSVKILMSMRPEPSMLSTVSGKGEMVLLHGDLIPIIRLYRYWNIQGAVEEPTRGLLVMVGEGGRKAALLVDELVTQQQFVVKPLTGIVANTKGVAGGAVLGNGDVGLILDPETIVSMALTPSGGTAAA